MSTSRGKRKNKTVNPDFNADGKLIVKPEFFGESLANEENSSILKASLEYPNRLQLNNPSLVYPAWERYQQIYKGVMPFNMATYGGYTFLDIQQVVELCQKAYFNVSIFRNTIDMMSEFSNSPLFFKGGNEKSRKLFQNWWNKIGGYNLLDQWLREWFRSGTVATYRIDTDVDASTLRKIGNVYGGETNKTKMKIPIRYILINPAYLRVDYGLNFNNQTYYKLLSNYELARLKEPVTEEEKELAKNLPDQVKEVLKGGMGNVAVFPLEPDKTNVVSCKKQDYEPFAMPMFFPVLEDIDLKLSYKRMEKILARTVEYVTLMINVGTEENPNPNALAALQELFRNESVGRVLVADGTTKMDFVIPDLSKAIGSEKYKVVNDDISYGLMNIFYGEEKFSATSVKIKVFMERLNEARRAFIEMFLNPEIKRIAKDLGLKVYPHGEFASIDLSDENLIHKLYAQIYQLGGLTNEELMDAIKTGHLPTPEESEESWSRFKTLRDKGYYEPLIGGGDNLSVENGKPVGTKGKPAKKAPSPAGKKKASEEDFEGFRLDKITEMFKTVNHLFAVLEKEAKKYFKVKKLNNSQNEALNGLIPLILSNESKENWEKSCSEYIRNPKPINNEVANEIDEISALFDTNLLLSSILRHCKNN